MDWLLEPTSWIALATLTALEIVLGIDNIVFISILTGKLPEDLRAKTRIIGLSLAMIMRILLLLSLTMIMRLTSPLFTVLTNQISGRDIILIAGGTFLIGKATLEIHDRVEGGERQQHGEKPRSFAATLAQIVVLDVVFSLDSVITAIGMANRIEIMVAAVILAVAFMLISSGGISSFVERHPTVKMLALSFLLLIGVALVADGLELHIPKGYIYFAMAFSLFVEMLNLRVRGRARPLVRLRDPHLIEDGDNGKPGDF
ncbi:MAG: TerC family protein [Thermodesulfovibrionales bacterium]